LLFRLKNAEDATDVAEIVTYFAKWGGVSRVEIARRGMARMIQIFKSKRALERKIERLNAREAKGVERLHARRRGERDEDVNNLFKLISDIVALQTEVLTNGAVAFFVTFDKSADARRCVHALGSFFVKKSLRFRNLSSLRVRRAPLPSEVIWENLEVKDRNMSS
jgi:hypothetical protein